MLTPEAVVLAEARRAYTTLSLFGYRVDGVVANRVFPAEGADDWRAGWVMAQDDVLAAGRRSRSPALPLWRSEYRAAEPVGVAALEDLARELYDGADPVASSGVREPVRGGHGPLGGVQLRLRLPFVTRDQVDLARSGDELVVTVGSVPPAAHAARRPGPAAGGRRPGRRRGRAAGLVPGSVRRDQDGHEGACRMTPPQDEPVGSVGEEAAKLLGGALAGLGRRPRSATSGSARSTTTSPPATPSASTARSAGPCTPCARPARR